MFGILLLGVLVASGNALPFRLEEDLFIRDLLKRGGLIGCKGVPGEVLFMFDTSKDVDDAQFEEDKGFAAKASAFLTKDIDVHAAVYGSSVKDVGTFGALEAQNDLLGVSSKAGGDRDVAKAIKAAGTKLTGSSKKIIVLFIDGDVTDIGAAKEAVAGLGEEFTVYVTVPKAKYNKLKDQALELTEDRFMRTKDMVLAEYFGMDLEIQHGGCP